MSLVASSVDLRAEGKTSVKLKMGQQKVPKLKCRGKKKNEKELEDNVKK